MKLYQSLVKESYAELSDGEVTITNVLTKLLRLSQLTGGFIGSEKAALLNRLVKQNWTCWRISSIQLWRKNRKLVIIARFVAGTGCHLRHA
jgi:hypothetical protein